MILGVFIKNKGNMSYFCLHGEMAEWSNAAVLKTVVHLRGPGVRIPLSPQDSVIPRFVRFFICSVSRQNLLKGGGRSK